VGKVDAVSVRRPVVGTTKEVRGMRKTCRVATAAGVVALTGWSWGMASLDVPELKEVASYALRKAAKVGKVGIMKSTRAGGEYTYVMETDQGLEFCRLNGSLIKSVKYPRQGKQTWHGLSASAGSRYMALAVFKASEKGYGGKGDWVGIYDSEGNLTWSVTGNRLETAIPSPCGDYFIVPPFPGAGYPPAFIGPSGIISRDYVQWRGAGGDRFAFSDTCDMVVTRAYGSNADKGNIVIMDRQGRVLRYLSSTYEFVDPIAISPSGDLAVGSSSSSLRRKVLEVFNTESGTAKWKLDVPMGTNLLTYGYEGRQLTFAGQQKSHVCSVNADTGKLEWEYIHPAPKYWSFKTMAIGKSFIVLLGAGKATSKGTVPRDEIVVIDKAGHRLARKHLPPGSLVKFEGGGGGHRMVVDGERITVPTKGGIKVYRVK
jgi:hypothetical protein